MNRTASANELSQRCRLSRLPVVAVAGALLLCVVPARAAELVVELEDRLPATVVDSGEALVQPMSGFGQGWGGDAQIFWRPEGVGSSLQTTFEAPAPGTYELVLFYTVAPDYGDFAVRVDDSPPTRVAGYGPGVAWRSTSLGQHDLAGVTQIQFVVEGRSPQSAGLILGLDRLELRAPGDGGIETTTMEPAPRVAIPALTRLPRPKPEVHDELAVVEGGTVRLARVGGDGSIQLGAPQSLPEGLHWVGNFDGGPADEILTWDPVSGDHHITRFSADGTVSSQKVGDSFPFSAEVYRTVGHFAEPGASCLFGWHEGRAFGVRSLVDGVCFSADAYLNVEGVAVATDVTGDGRDEAVFITPAGTLDVMVLGEAYRPAGQTYDQLEYTQQRAADQWSPGLEIAVANVDDDPGQEIVAMVRSKAEVWRLDFDAAGRVASRVLLASGWPPDRSLGWSLDTDGDGREELIALAPASRQIWLAAVGADSLQLTELAGVDPSFVYPARLGSPREALVFQRVDPGEGGLLGVLTWDDVSWRASLVHDPALRIPEFATVLVGDYLPD